MLKHATILAALSPLLFACAANGTGATPSKDDVRAGGKADNGVDYCQEFGWYGDGECDDFCTQRDPDCASDERSPELGNDPSLVLTSATSMDDALAMSETKYGPTIEAKFELGDDGKLSLSVYPAGKPLTMDAERNVFQELAGDPTVRTWTPGLEVFHDQEHLTRSARDLTLVQLSRLKLRDVVHAAQAYGSVYWAIPTLQDGRAGYGLYLLADGVSEYYFVDGEGSGGGYVHEYADGPGSGATDARTPELGDDPGVVTTAKIKMSDALRAHGPAIEAKFEIGDDGKLSLSIYPVGKEIATDAERNTFFELAGDPTAAPFSPSKSEFTVPDEEHLTRSARDLTIVQAARLTLLQAVEKIEAKVPGGAVYWAIPTIRGTRAGYGIYTWDHGKSRYFFVS